MKEGRKGREISQFLPSVFAPVFYCTKGRAQKLDILFYFYSFLGIGGKGIRERVMVR